MKSSLKPHCRSVPKPQVWETAVLLTASDMWTIHGINQDNDHVYIYKYTYMCIFFATAFWDYASRGEQSLNSSVLGLCHLVALCL